MRDHIINILEQTPFTRLGEAERAIIESHVVNCPACLQAYEAARLSVFLINARASEQVEPPPFFETRVMAALKERKAAQEPSALIRMWKAAGALVWSMSASVLILVGLTFFVSNSEPPSAASESVYSLDSVMVEQSDEQEGSMTYDEALAIIYDTGGGYGQ
jgi:hypothetical protein